MSAESVAVPFRMMTDGRKCLTDQQLVEEPHLMAFVKRFASMFERHPMMDVWIYRDDRFG
jgi:hypothetical protein